MSYPGRYRRSILAAVLIAATGCADDTGPEPETELPLPVQRISFDVGDHHACALDTQGGAWCWGNNWRGELGNGTQVNSAIPVRVIGDHVFTAISVSNWTACGLEENGTAWCWGDNQAGELGAGTYGEAAFSATPLRVLSPEPFIAISAGSLQTCGLTSEGKAYCWGDNSRGAIGSGSNDPDPISTPTAVAGNLRFQSINSGVWSVCGITRGEAAGYCWGLGEYGILGNGSTENSSTPVRIASNEKWVDIEPDHGVSCAIAATERLYCWGIAASVKTGRLWEIERLALTPEVLATPANVKKLEGLCVTAAVGNAMCVTSVIDSSGMHSTIGTASAPASVPFVRVAGTYSRACGQSADGAIYCWGSNSYGQAGNGTVSGEVTQPVMVAGNVDWAR